MAELIKVRCTGLRLPAAAVCDGDHKPRMMVAQSLGTKTERQLAIAPATDG
jgi:hypothetical protein